MSPQSSQAQDKVEIHELVARLFHSIDDKDLDAYRALFVDDATSESPFANLQGKAALSEFFTHHVGPQGMGDGKRHFALNVHSDVDGDRARVTFDLLVSEVRDIPKIIATARYDANEVVRTSDGWKFKRLKQVIDPGFFKMVEAAKSKAG
jgi:ketosteroid isomerase-like protein